MKTKLFLVIATLTLIISASIQAQPSPRARQEQTARMTKPAPKSATDWGIWAGVKAKPTQQPQTKQSRARVRR